MESLVFMANGLYLASYFMNDILRLRYLTITAACCLAAYFYLQPIPMMTVVYWNLFFVALNIFQICRLLMERAGLDFRAGKKFKVMMRRLQAGPQYFIVRACAA